MCFLKFLELQGGVLRIVLKQGELFVGTFADVGGQVAVVVPKIRVRAVDYQAGRLKRLRVSGPVVRQYAIDPVVDPPRVKIGFELRFDRVFIFLHCV